MYTDKMEMTKKQLRKYIKPKIQLMTSQEKDFESLSIMEKLIRHPLYSQSHRIGIYQHLPDEVKTNHIIEKCREDNKIIFYPKITNSVMVMEMETEMSGNSNDQIDLLIVPGRAFDKNGNRLGRGGGYYDRYLEEHPSILTVGICFDCQIVNKISVEKHDKRVDVIIYNNVNL